MNTIPTLVERFPFPTSLCPPIAAQTPPGDDAPPPKRRIRYGVLKGQIRVAADFDAPLPEHVLSSFEGRA
jgi:hypothetical protein